MDSITNRGMRSMPQAERPTERLLEIGPQSLTIAELIAVIIRCGNRRESALEAGMRIISENGGPSCLARMSAAELSLSGKIGITRAAQLKAAVELGVRLMGGEVRERPCIEVPKDAANLLMLEMRYLPCEEFRSIMLDSKRRVIDISTISTGTLTSSLVHPRELFREAIIRNSAALIVAHNHPSGDPTPSKEDMAVTERLVKAGKLMGIEVLDHIIIGDNVFTSMVTGGILGNSG
jgi:DNA repair protein RadC